MANRTALLIGASGLVGGHCLEYLLREQTYDKVRILVRKSINKQHPKLEEHIIDFDNLEASRSIISGTDLFSCIGTTFLKSPNREDYYRIDFTYPHTIAKIAKENGCEQFSFVSAYSAKPNAIFFYSRVKGQFEEAMKELGFKTLNIMRPSYMRGERSEFRPIEKIGGAFLKLISPLLLGPFRSLRPIEAKKVAYAMVKASLEAKPGVNVFVYDDIIKF